jgi:hypothetical protein
MTSKVHRPVGEDRGQAQSGERYQRSRNGALKAWAHIAQALQGSDTPQDRALAENIKRFVRESAYIKEIAQRRQRETVHAAKQRQEPLQTSDVSKSRPRPTSSAEFPILASAPKRAVLSIPVTRVRGRTVRPHPVFERAKHVRQ